MRLGMLEVTLILITLLARVVPLVLAGGILLLAVRWWRKREAKAVGGQPPAQQPAGAGNTAAPDGLTLPERLRQLRSTAGYSQELLAERLGVSRQAVSKWETGTAEPSTANLLALADLYGITVDVLLRGPVTG